MCRTSVSGLEQVFDSARALVPVGDESDRRGSIGELVCTQQAQARPMRRMYLLDLSALEGVAGQYL